MEKKKIGLLPKIVIAIASGIVCGLFFPDGLVRIFLTVNGLFSNFLGFIIPLLILGLVAPGIADLGKGAGRLLLITALLAYGFTLFSGFFTYLASDLSYPWLLKDAELQPQEMAVVEPLTPYFTVMMPPLMDVMTSLVLAFTLGLGMSVINGATLKEAMEDFKDIINKVITGVIIPLLPALYFRYFLEYLEFRTGFRCVGRVREDYRDDIFPDDHTVVYPILHCRNRVEEESVPVVSKYVAGLHDRFGNTVFRRDNSRDVGANDKKWRQPGTSHFRNPALCHDTLVG